MVPLAVIARPGFTTRALNSVAGLRLARSRVRDDSALLAGKLPAWVFLAERLDPMSATALRTQGLWPPPLA
jgi:hypothetical protein